MHQHDRQTLEALLPQRPQLLLKQLQIRPLDDPNCLPTHPAHDLPRFMNLSVVPSFDGPVFAEDNGAFVALRIRGVPEKGDPLVDFDDSRVEDSGTANVQIKDLGTGLVPYFLRT